MFYPDGMGAWWPPQDGSTPDRMVTIADSNPRGTIPFQWEIDKRKTEKGEELLSVAVSCMGERSSVEKVRSSQLIF